MNRTTVAQSLVNKLDKSAQNCTTVHARRPPPTTPPYIHDCAVRTIVQNPGVGTHSAGPAGGGPDERARSQDWEQAANIAILKAMVHFPGRDPATTWQLARKAAAWMRRVQIDNPKMATGDYLLKKVFEKYESLPVLP